LDYYTIPKTLENAGAKLGKAKQHEYYMSKSKQASLRVIFCICGKATYIFIHNVQKTRQFERGGWWL